MHKRIFPTRGFFRKHEQICCSLKVKSCLTEKLLKQKLQGKTYEDFCIGQSLNLAKVNIKYIKTLATSDNVLVNLQLKHYSNWQHETMFS